MDPNEIKELTEIALRVEEENRERWLQTVEAQKEKNKEDREIGDEQVILKYEQECPGWTFASFFDALTTVNIRSYLRQAAMTGCMGILVDIIQINGDCWDGQRICRVTCCPDIYAGRRERELGAILIPRSLLGIVAMRLIEWAQKNGLEAYHGGWEGVAIFLKRPPSTLNNMRGV